MASYKKEKLLTLREHLCSSRCFGGVHVAHRFRCLCFCVLFVFFPMFPMSLDFSFLVSLRFSLTFLYNSTTVSKDFQDPISQHNLTLFQFSRLAFKIKKKRNTKKKKLPKDFEINWKAFDGIAFVKENDQFKCMSSYHTDSWTLWFNSEFVNFVITLIYLRSCFSHDDLFFKFKTQRNKYLTWWSF